MSACVGSLCATPVFYAAAPTLIARTGILASRIHNKPYRDDYVYLFTPWSLVETSADTMSRHAVALARGNGLIIVEDPTAQFAVRYRVLRDAEKNVEVVQPVAAKARSAEAVAAGRAVVLVPLDRDNPSFDPSPHRWKRDGDLYLLD